MALVRCPDHNIPFNDENPRGCPACAREREGGGEAAIMRELAKVTRRTGERPAVPIMTGDGASSAPTDPSDPFAVSPVTSQPRIPATDISRVEEFLWQLGRPRTIVAGVALIALLVLWVVLSSGPRFVPEPHPVPFQGTIRPLPVEPNTPLNALFAVLGPRAPQAHPTAPQLARYSYGADLVVDALNGEVYAVTFRVPNRSWHGLRIGIPRRMAEGALALLAMPTDQGVVGSVEAYQIEGYATYPSLDALPTQTLAANVRPPNGCYDVEVQLSPKVSGLLLHGDQRYVVVGTEGSEMEWTVTSVRIVSRSVRGPYAAGIAC